MIEQLSRATLPDPTFAHISHDQQRGSIASLYERSPEMFYEITNQESMVHIGLQLYIKTLQLSHEVRGLTTELNTAREDIVTMAIEISRLSQIEQDYKLLLKQNLNPPPSETIPIKEPSPPPLDARSLLSELHQQKLIYSALLDQHQKLIAKQTEQLIRPSVNERQESSGKRYDPQTLMRENYNLKCQNEDLNSQIQMFRRQRITSTELDGKMSGTTTTQMKGLDGQIKTLLQYAQRNQDTQQQLLQEIDSLKNGKYQSNQDPQHFFDKEAFQRTYFANNNPVFNWHQSLKFIERDNSGMKLSIKVNHPTANDQSAITEKNEQIPEHSRQSSSVNTLQKAQGIYIAKKLRIKSQFAGITSEKKVMINQEKDQGGTPILFRAQSGFSDDKQMVLKRRTIMSAKQLRR